MAQFIAIGLQAFNVENVHGGEVSRNPDPPATGDINLITVTFSDGHPSIEFTGHDVATFRSAWQRLGFPNLPSA